MLGYLANLLDLYADPNLLMISQHPVPQILGNLAMVVESIVADPQVVEVAFSPRYLLVAFSPHSP